MIIRLLLGDQLFEKHPWFDKVDDKVLYVQMELRQETDYCLHHIQKLSLIHISEPTRRS